LKEWSRITLVSRCGLGQTAANPIINSLVNFPELYHALINKEEEYISCFNMEAAVADSCKVVNRVPNL
jgi:hypothetical protein